MSISKRVSIAWPPDRPASETTDTMVLSFPSAHFIDLRFVKDATPAKLEWGFAGRTETSGTRTTFIHLIDSSRPLDPQSVEDVGNFEILPDGIERETGEVVDGRTGKVMHFEEIWQKFPKSTTPGAVCLRLAADGAQDAFMGRVGEWFQGICVRDGKVSVVRRKLNDKGEWEDILAIGDDLAALPSIEVQDSVGWTVEHVVEYKDRQWLVLDVVQ